MSASAHARPPPPKPAAVLCIAFNRADLLQQVLEAISQAGPREVFVAIDGPRPDRPGEAELCRAVEQVARDIPWASRVQLKVEPRNLGCRAGVTSAIDWALSLTPEIIVFEDDCLPHPSFLYFCDELLHRYRDDERVMQIAGTNWGASPERYAGYSYAFTSFAPIWGWATWRRAWALHEPGLASWPRVKASGLAEGMAQSRRFRRLLERDWEAVRAGQMEWDREWQYAVLRHHGLSLSPARNLVKNIGFRADSTHLKGADRIFSKLPADPISFPLHHPPEVARNAAVEFIFEQIYWQRTGWLARLYRWLVRSERLRKLARVAIDRLMPRPT